MGSYLPHTEEERGEMLEAIGVHTIEELYRSVPQEMLLSAGLDLPEGMSELEVRTKVSSYAQKNRVFQTVLRGAGAYRHMIPSVVKAVMSREELVTCYTPTRRRSAKGCCREFLSFRP